MYYLFDAACFNIPTQQQAPGFSQQEGNLHCVCEHFISAPLCKYLCCCSVAWEDSPGVHEDILEASSQTQDSLLFKTGGVE